MVKALQAVHGLGVLHRDVKPSNFVLGGRYRSSADPSQANKLFIIDFGLSRKFMGIDGEIKPPRANAGFRGTARYASVNSHQCKELAPRDDLWSVFYVMVEFATGSLPWRNQRDRDKVGEIKAEYLKGKKLTEGLPPEFEQFQDYLLSLDYYSKPDYAMIIKKFHDLLLRILGLPLTTETIPPAQLPPFDWEKPAPSSTAPSRCSSNASSANGDKKELRLPIFKRRATKPHNVPVGSMAAGTTGQTTLFEEDDNAHDIDGDADASGVPLANVADDKGGKKRESKEDLYAEEIKDPDAVVTQAVVVRNDGAAGDDSGGGGSPDGKEKKCCCVIM